MKARESDPERTFSPAAEKSFRSALRHLIREEFPRLGGEKVVSLFSEELLDLIERHHLTRDRVGMGQMKDPPDGWGGQAPRPRGDVFSPRCPPSQGYTSPATAWGWVFSALSTVPGLYLTRDRVGMGQMLWYAVDAEDPPWCHKRVSETHMVPVLLSLITPEDVAARRRGEEGSRERAKRVAARLLRKAWAQGGVLSLADLALIMRLSPGYLSELVRDWEEEHQEVLPRRGTVHDLGPSVSHKALICRKAIVEGKQTPEIARETYHSEASVDRYLLDLERVAYAMLKHHMSQREICFTTQMSEGLVSQYAQLVSELGLAGEDLLGKEVSAPSSDKAKAAMRDFTQTESV